LFETDSSYPWIQLDSSTTTLFGDAPQGLEDSVVNVKIKAKSRKSGKSASLSFDVAIRAVSDGKGSAPTDSGADPTESSDGQRSSANDSPGNRRFNPVLLAVLLPLLLLLGLAVCALFWYFRRRQDSQRPPLSTRDISGPLPGTFVAGPDVSHSLPDFTKRFGKSFSADDVFGPEKRSYFNSRQFFLTRPELPQSTGSVRLLPPSDSPSSDPGTPQEGSKPPAVVGGALSALRPGTRGKISSSLSSITERSIGELVDSRGLESVGSDSRRAFRDKIEINVPRVPQTPSSTHIGSPSPTEAMSTPRPGSSRTALDTDSAPLRPDSRVSDYPPASAARKLSWPWLKGVKGKRQGTKLVPGMQRLSEQPSVLTVDTFASERTDKPSPTIPVTQGSDANEAAVVESDSLPLPPFPSRASLSRPPTRSSPVVTSGNLGSPGPEPHHTSDTTPTNILPTPVTTSLLSPPDNSVPSLPLPSRGETPKHSLDMYDGIAGEHSPFRPSRTWSTVPTTDEWVDETVESLALSRSPSSQQQQQQQNWTVLQESSVKTSHEFTTLGRGLPDIASSIRLGQAREGGSDGKGGVEVSAGLPPVWSGPVAAAMARIEGGQKREASGLTRKSRSMGVSLRSEGSRSDYAAFI
jgi:axial budding pattern protein 2